MKETKHEYPYNLLEGMLNIYHSDSRFNEMILLNYKDIVANIENNWDYVLATLTPREVVFITLYYKESKTYKEIAKTHGITQERVRQVINKGLRYLTHPSRMRLLAIPKEKLNEYKTFNDQIDEEIARLKRELHQIKTNGVNYITSITKATDIEELWFSTRTYNALKRARINTLDDLISHTVEELSQIRNLGRKSLKEICMKLHEKGYNLKDGPFDNSLYSFLNDDDDDE